MREADPIVSGGLLRRGSAEPEAREDPGEGLLTLITQGSSAILRHI